MAGTRIPPPYIDVTQTDWSKGIVSDVPLTNLPRNACADLVDFLPHEPGILRRRGGTQYVGSALTGASYIRRVYASTDVANQIIGIGNNHHLYTIDVSTGTVVDKGTTTIYVNNGVYRSGPGNDLLCLTGLDGAPRKFNGSTVSLLGGSPPGFCAVATVYKTRLVLGNQNAPVMPNRLWFSPTPDIEAAWDTTNSWIDMEQPITALIPLQNSLLVFSEHQCSALVGSTPPTSADSGDFNQQLVGRQGVIHQKSVITWNGYAVFANASGVYMTNGVGFRDLTQAGGIKDQWRQMNLGIVTTGTDPQCPILGLYQNFLIAFCPGSQMLVCHLPTDCWFRFARLNPLHFTTGSSAAGSPPDETYYGEAGTNRVTAISNCFTPGVQQIPAFQALAKPLPFDADGSAIEPYIRTRPFGVSLSLNEYSFGWLNYDLRDTSGGTNPNLTVVYVPGYTFEATGGVTVGTFAETSQDIAHRFTVGTRSKALSLMIQQNGASDKTDIFGIRVQQRPFPTMELADQH